MESPSLPFQSKSDYTYAVIKRRILSEELPPGGVVSQERLSAEIGVSTTPMREALKRLATEGLVDLGLHRDARVTDLTATEARSLYEVREQLDPLAARLAAQRRTPEDLAEISSALGRLAPLSASDDWGGIVAHREFHRSIHRAAHNQPLLDVLEGLWDKADRYRQVTLRTHARSRSEIARVKREHKMLADAVRAGDHVAAERTMLDHVAGSLGRRAIDDLVTPEPAGGPAHD